MEAERDEKMRPLDLESEQELFLVVGGEGEDARMLTEDDNLVVLESLWHAGPLVHNLHDLGIQSQIVRMSLEAFYYLAEGLDMGLWVLHHDGTVTAIEDIVFVQE